MRSSFQSFRLSGLLFIGFAVLFLLGCKKQTAVEELQSPQVQKSDKPGHLKQTKTFSSEVPIKWLQMLLRVNQVPPATPGGDPARILSYGGVALYEAVVNGMPSYQTLYGQLTSMPAMPATEPGKAYHWPTCANAALAYMNKHFFTLATVSDANIASMDSLENALNTEYQAELNNTETFQRSKDFGRTVAERIFTWSTTDGSDHANDPYTPNGPPGSWTNTAPNPTGIAEPYWDNNRSFVPGVSIGTASPLPPTYSTDPNSAYYAMVKEVYDVSLTLTPEQTATALYYRDNPGYPQATNYISTFSQVMQVENPQLDFYALAYAKTGIAFAEAMINCRQIKYSLLQDRPTLYIRLVLGHSSWNPLIAMPPHPEFPSAHSQMAGAVTKVLTNIFGDNYHFTLHTYDYLGMAPRNYNSFEEMAVDIGKARVYGGLHYTYSCVEGRKQGERIATNVLNTLKFKK